MKKLIPILLVAVIALTSCQNKNPYAGVYSGSFQFFKFSSTDITQAATSSDNKTGKMQFLTNPLTNGLLLYSMIPLNSITTEHYTTTTDAIDFINQMVKSIGNTNSIYDTSMEQIKNITITADFSGNTVHAEVQYEIAILNSITTRITIVKFDGVK